MLQQVIDYLLFGLLVKSSDIEGDEFELIPLRSHFREISVDFLTVTIGKCTSSVFSVAICLRIIAFAFFLGLSLVDLLLSI